MRNAAWLFKLSKKMMAMRREQLLHLKLSWGTPSQSFSLKASQTRSLADRVGPNMEYFTNLHPRKLTCPLKRDHFSREYIFQASIFRGRSLVFRGVPFSRICSSFVKESVGDFQTTILVYMFCVIQEPFLGGHVIPQQSQRGTICVLGEINRLVLFDPSMICGGL